MYRDHPELSKFGNVSMVKDNNDSGIEDIGGKIFMNTESSLCQIKVNRFTKLR